MSEQDWFVGEKWVMTIYREDGQESFICVPVVMKWPRDDGTFEVKTANTPQVGHTLPMDRDLADRFVANYFADLSEEDRARIVDRCCLK
jgi:hypothetical protein